MTPPVTGYPPMIRPNCADWSATGPECLPARIVRAGHAGEYKRERRAQEPGHPGREDGQAADRASGPDGHRDGEADRRPAGRDRRAGDTATHGRADLPRPG